MDEYIKILINAFFTGFGVISANEIWLLIKKWREHIDKRVKNALNNKELEK